jgi:glycine hydroxymethyltransferase
MQVIAAKAVAFGEALHRDFKHYQEQVIDNARVMAKVLQERGVRVVSGGTDSHMMLVDLAREGNHRQGCRGCSRAAAYITVNKNAIPNDPEKPMVTSGIRIGSPAMTTRGFEETEAEEVAHLIVDILEAPNDEATISRATGKVKALTAKYPVYG